ncbi:Cdc6/Cdc18 family protein [Natronobacterium gregoryi]|uniref:AAA ATPase n=2 Tax=Natronobacterium gregoryi TaxID=44930 RepID=L0AJ37_NATGS|nr:AAA family ATPase [Natronobacterium gregoryi]AFZ73070.1 Cdc6-related protein, AAA superfamily ATPase [Natronobacterium gregoryi SP2]ELY70829.1 AAA ATPase [Natronobacterium gregoryi SP2]PLK20409.1 AAA family ATPase [Natronobacterium gregoryi SP2]SFI61972.1 Cdc6-related protein, AAA superfamily ATPase [Natronobacterium gregoryi]
MIADPQVFDDGYDGVELLHRGGEMDEVLRRIAATDGVLISGPSGVGKTLFARKVIDELGRVEPVAHAHVNCLGKTTAAVLRAVLEDHPYGPDDVRQTMATDTVRDELQAATEERETVIVLDEGDDLPETDAVGELLELDAKLIAITHDKRRWLSRLDVDDGHPFDRGTISLGRYGVDELTEILERRARQGFHHPDVITRGQLEYIADEVAGVARNGIQRLWGAAVEARDRGHVRIHDEDIERGEERAWRRIRELNLESLPTHHQVLYAIVHEAGAISGDRLHERYEEVAADVYHGTAAQPIGRRARREKFPKLREYDLVEYEGPTRSRVYEVADPDVEPKVDLP